MTREYQRNVPRGPSEVRYALKWAEGVLSDWLMTHEEAALIVTEPRRTGVQNDKMWAMLTDVAKQVRWMVDGELRFIDSEDWKHILSAGLKRHQRVAAGIDGGFVILGQSTRRLTKAEFSDLIEIIYEFGARHDVVWSEPSKQVISEHQKRKEQAA